MELFPYGLLFHQKFKMVFGSAKGRPASRFGEFSPLQTQFVTPSETSDPTHSSRVRNLGAKMSSRSGRSSSRLEPKAVALFSPGYLIAQRCMALSSSAKSATPP